MIQLKKEMIEAIAEAVERAGSQMEFERKSGIRQSTINKILNGKSRSIADRTWRDLLPYLDSSRIAVGNTFGSNCRIQSDNNFLPFEKGIEAFRSDLIAEIIMLDIDPVAKDTVLKTITAFKRVK